mmetsp:Transcript_25632/g.42042  ORF Transcript_25632/g.42042 Transcript_25632/m.42042 type:complete len:83 (-) Transcript_25632:264-512(-)
MLSDHSLLGDAISGADKIFSEYSVALDFLGEYKERLMFCFYNILRGERRHDTKQAFEKVNAALSGWKDGTTALYRSDVTFQY